MKTYKFKYDLGQKVKIKNIDVFGQIDSIQIDSGGEMYRVVYWINGERKTTWVYEWGIH